MYFLLSKGYKQLLMPLQQFIYLVSKQLAGEAGAAELLQLQQLLAQHPEWEGTYQTLLAAEERRGLTEEEQLKAEQAYALHSVKLQFQHMEQADGNAVQLRTKSRRGKLLAVMAGCAVLVTAGAGWWWHAAGTADELQSSQIVARRGARTEVVLPDSSRVWINSDSRLTYNSQTFGKRDRELWLSGEAFFEVAKQASHPFIIHSGNIHIKVLGTSFNVKSYPGDATTETSLINGKVQVSFTNRPDENIILHPNEKLTVSNETSISNNHTAVTEARASITVNNLSQVNTGDQITETAWMRNRIAFSDASLAEIASVLERHFDVTVQFAGQDVMNYRYTGNFEGENLEKMLAVMKLSKPFNYSINGKKVTITN